MLSVMQVSRDDDSYEYSFDEFASQCDQLGLSSIHNKSKRILKCSGSSHDSGTDDDSYSVEDFEPPQKEEVVGEYASSQDRQQSAEKVRHPRRPVPKSTTPNHPEDLQQEVSVPPQSQKRVPEVEHEDQYIVVTIVATPLDEYPTPDVQSSCQDEDVSGVCPATRAQNQEDPTESLHCEHTKRPASSAPRCSYDAETKSMKLKKATNTQRAERKSKKVSCYSVERLAQLSKPVERRSSHSVDDNKTTHKPKNTSLDTSNDGPSFLGFLERMESKEAERKEKAQRAAARALYDAKVDKVISFAATLDCLFRRVCPPHSPRVWNLSERMFVKAVAPSNRLRKCTRAKRNVARMVVETRSIAMFLPGSSSLGDSKNE